MTRNGSETDGGRSGRRFSLAARHAPASRGGRLRRGRRGDTGAEPSPARFMSTARGPTDRATGTRLPRRRLEPGCNSWSSPTMATRRARPIRPPTSTACSVLDAVEISTNGGHLIALDMPPSPYPLGGESAAVVEDVMRLGGMPVAAHPDSAKAELGVEGLGRRRSRASSGSTSTAAGVTSPARDWRAWRSTPWCGRVRLSRPFWIVRHPRSRAGTGSPRRGPWSPWPGTMHTAAWLGDPKRGVSGGIPGLVSSGLASYDTSFATFAVRVVLDEPADGRRGRGRSAAVRRGACRSCLLPPSTRSPRRPGSTSAPVLGAVAAGDGGRSDIRRRSRADVPFHASSRCDRGAAARRRESGRVRNRGAAVLAHRRQGYTASKSERRRAGPVDRHQSDLLEERCRARPDGCRAARARGVDGPGAVGPWTRGEGSRVDRGAHFERRRQSGSRLPAPRRRAGESVRRYRRSAARRACRSSTALSSPAGRRHRCASRSRRDSIIAGGARWVHSVYLSPDSRQVVVPVDRLLPADRPSPPPPFESASSLLFVVDLTNASPGGQGRFEISDLRLASDAAFTLTWIPAHFRTPSVVRPIYFVS